MKNNIKKIIAVVLAAACLSGCAANEKDHGEPPLSTPETSSTGTSEPEASDADTSETTSNVNSSKSTTSSTPTLGNWSGSKYFELGDITYHSKPNSGSTSSDSGSPSGGGYKPRLTEEEKLVDALIDELDLDNDKKSDLEKLCILGKWFCDNTEYDDDLAKGHSIGDAATEVEYLLTKHTGKCSSYAKAACLILSKCGIDTLYCSNGNIDHAWNAVKIDGQWTYTDFVGGPDTVILGSSRHGVPKYTVITRHNGGYSGKKPDISEISEELRLFDFNGKELEVHKEADGYRYVDSNGVEWKTTF